MHGGRAVCTAVELQEQCSQPGAPQKNYCSAQPTHTHQCRQQAAQHPTTPAPSCRARIEPCSTQLDPPTMMHARGQGCVHGGRAATAGQPGALSSQNNNSAQPTLNHKCRHHRVKRVNIGYLFVMSEVNLFTHKAALGNDHLYGTH